MPCKQNGIFLFCVPLNKANTHRWSMVKTVQSQWSGHCFSHKYLKYLIITIPLHTLWTVPTPAPQNGTMSQICKCLLMAVQSLRMRLPCLGRKRSKHEEAWGATSHGCGAREQMLPTILSNSCEVTHKEVFSWFYQESLLFRKGYFVHS